MEQHDFSGSVKAVTWKIPPQTKEEALERLQEFYLIALDVFRKIPYPESEKNEQRAWLSLLTTESLKDAEKLIQDYPWLEEIYQEIAMLRQRPEEVLEMWSDALRILDENSMKFYVEELEEKVRQLTKEKDEQLLQVTKEKDEQLLQVTKEKDAEIAALKKQLEAINGK